MGVGISILFWLLVIALGGLGAYLLRDFIDCLTYCVKHKKDRRKLGNERNV